MLNGRVRYTAVLVCGYLALCGIIGGVFSVMVVHDGDIYDIFSRIVIGGFLVGVLVIVNLLGLLVQSVF